MGKTDTSGEVKNSNSNYFSSRLTTTHSDVPCRDLGGLRHWIDGVYGELDFALFIFYFSAALFFLFSIQKLLLQLNFVDAVV